MSARRRHRARHGRNGRATRDEGDLRGGHPDRPVRHVRRLSGLQAPDLHSNRRFRYIAVPDRRDGHLRISSRSHGHLPAAEQGHQRSRLPDQPVVVHPHGRSVPRRSRQRSTRDAGCCGPLGILNADLSINGASVDGDRRLKMVYGTPIHGPYCPRYQNFVNNKFAAKPGDAGCLQKIGCKGPATNSLCGMHGWNNQQPQNPATWDYGVPAANFAPNGVTRTGGHCTCSGHPCMACTEKGYPDSFVPFVAR